MYYFKHKIISPNSTNLNIYNLLSDAQNPFSQQFRAIN